MSIIKQIREKYPNAQASITTGEYCVGGACALFAEITNNRADYPGFPFSHTIADSLQKLNPTLERHAALAYAVSIMTLNDRNHIEQAWMIAECAIRDY